MNSQGTVRYMAPEALRAEPLTPAADIYSLGITMWQLKHRQLPYSWIECNEIVAYQVVKNDLRPNKKPTKTFLEPSSAQKQHINCFCQNLTASSHLSYYSLENLRNMLVKSSNDSCEASKLLSEIIPTHIKKAPVCQRLPFTNLNVKSLKELKKDKNLKPSGLENKCNGHDLKKIFAHNMFWRSMFKESIYEDICKCCWYSDFRARPNSKELLQRLQQLLL